MTDIKRFSDFSTEEDVLSGNKIKIKEIIGKEIIVIGYKINPSKYGDNKMVLKLGFKLFEENRVVFTGSKVLIEQIEKYKDEIPFITKIENNNDFYTLT